MRLQPDLSTLSQDERDEHDRLCALVQAYFAVIDFVPAPPPRLVTN